MSNSRRPGSSGLSPIYSPWSGVGVSPTSRHMPAGMSDFLEDVLGSTVPVITRQEAKPFFDVHDLGFGLTECQPSLLEELFHPWSGIGFQYVPSKGRDHKVIGVAHDGYAFVQAFA